MAENKKSFVLYTDSQGLVNQLPDEVAGRLLKHIYAYVNDENPISDDLLLNIAFEPIKMQLKRDLQKWETQIETRSASGRLGNLKRWNLDLYEKVVLKELTLIDAEIIAINRKESQSDVLPSQEVANVAVNDNVNVSVNVNDNVILLEKETKGDLSELEILPLNNQTKKEKKVAPKKEITLPDGFSEIWDLWLEYRKAKKLKDYAGDKFEQMAIDKLIKYSESNPEIANKIINEAITNTWTGFFPLKETFKPQSNGTTTTNTKQQFKFSTANAIKTITGET